MATAGVIWNALRLVNLEVDIRNVCVMMAPAFSGLTAWSTYLCVLIILKNIGIVQLSPGRLTLPLSLAMQIHERARAQGPVRGRSAGRCLHRSCAWCVRKRTRSADSTPLAD